MYVRVVRFTDVSAERIEQLVARVQEEGGPPPGVPTMRLQALFDESQGTALVLQLFNTADDMRKGAEVFGLQCVQRLEASSAQEVQEDCDVVHALG